MTEYLQSVIDAFKEPYGAIVQLLGFVPVVIGFLAFSFRERGKIIAAKAISDGIFAIHFFLLGSKTAGMVCVVNMIRGILFAKRGCNAWSSSRYLPILFCGLTAVASALGWSGPESLLPMLGSCFAVIGYWCANPRRLRLWNLTGISLWLIYGLITLSIATIVSNAAYIISILLTMIRERRKQHDTDPLER